jgi:predicted RNA-binding Zn-ribbon protein involved in translation (DUF1610 family)
MSNVTLGQITSKPDADGNHQLKCPQCRTEFLEHITRDEETRKINNTICEACGYSGEPVEFLYHANKEATDKMVGDYAIQELKKIFNGKSIKIR